MKKVFLIINEGHSMFPQQEQILEEKFPGYEKVFIRVPANGWTLEEMKQQMDEIHYAAAGAEIQLIGNHKVAYYPATKPGNVVIFVSPIPYLLKELTRRSVNADEYFGGIKFDFHYETLVFHNDRREKKELPDGRIIQVVAQEGWQLV